MRSSVSYAALVSACLSCGPVALAAAQDVASGEEVVVTATRAGKGVPRAQLGSSVTLIQPADLDLRQVRVVSDVLRDIPGVSVSRTGAVGGLTQVRLRGAEGNHTLVLIDGMEVSDPYYGEFDFATLIADEVARVEVLRGQQSALYGSDAIGGVINYITLSGRDAPGNSARLEGGSFGSFDAAARLAGAGDRFDYAISGGYQSSDGTPTSRFGTRRVGADNAALSGRFAYEVTANLRLRAIGRYARTWAETNDQDYRWGSPTYGFVIDSDDEYRNESYYGLVGVDLDLLDGAWTHAFTLQGVDAQRAGYSGGALDYGDRGRRLKASYVTAYHVGSDAAEHTITGALDWERETFQNRGPFLAPEQARERDTVNTGFVAQYDLLIGDHLGLGAAIRHDVNDRFQNATTYRVQGSYAFASGTRLHAAGGSGIKNPGIFELYGYDPGNFIGNPDLKAERSTGWEAGLEQALLGDRAFVDVTYFNSRLTDEIYSNYDNYPIVTPGNRDTASEQKGVEVSVQALLGEGWRLFASYTYLHAVEDGREEVRRPPHIGSVNLGYIDPSDRFNANVTVRYNGETFDNNFTATGGPRVLLDAFTLVNLDGELRLTDTLRLYGRIENVFDADYEEVYTYRTPGRAGYLGLKARF